MRKKGKYCIAFILVVFAVKGCGIFDTREPESPENVRSTFITPASADIVISNLENSILQKNSENYNKCLSAVNFKYTPDSKSQLIYELIFADWTQAEEKKYLDNVILSTGSSSSALFLSNRRLTQISSDSALFQADYTVVFQHNKPDVPKSARGNLSMSIATDNDDLFYIRRWEDFRQNDTDFTWSELKANFSY